MSVEDKYRMKMSMNTIADAWKENASTCTTSDFRDLGKGYVRHCGPTAAANIIQSLYAKYEPDYRPEPDWTFLTCAKTGERSLLYGNMDLFGRYGGTSDLLAPLYLTLCMRACCAPGKVVGWKPLCEKFVREALGRGSLLYMEVRRHPKYHDHHFVCYGARELRDTSGRKIAFFLMCADGWSHSITPVALSSIKFGTFYEIQKDR